MKYQVEIKEIHTASIEIEANSPEQARELVQQALMKDDIITETTYYYTTEPDTWLVSRWDNGSLSLCLRV